MAMVSPGDRFGYWTVLRAGVSLTRKDRPTGYRRWVCRCQCGTERPMLERTLRAGKTPSCGCQLGQPSILDRFWGFVERKGPDECWPWQAGADRGGYGLFSVHGRLREKSHRMAWQLTQGAIPDGLWVLHRCDNPPCCNPAHLFLGTPADNSHDRFAKGRGIRGTTAPRSKLTEAQVREIRRRYAAGELGAPRLARQYGVATHSIQMIVRGQSWAWLDQDPEENPDA